MTTDDLHRAEVGDDADLDADLVAEELARLERLDPTEHQRAGGASRGLAWLLTLGGALGLWSALALVLSERKLRMDPDAVLACDINPLVGCGSFITSWQASVLGIPNALIGVIAYSIVLTTGVVLLGGSRLPRLYWRGLMGGVILGAIAITWLQYQAFFSLRGLCPYCLVVWAVTIPLVVHVLAAGAQAGHVPVGRRLRTLLVRERHVLVAGWVILVVVAIAVVFWDQWMLLL